VGSSTAFLLKSGESGETTSLAEGLVRLERDPNLFVFDAPSELHGADSALGGLLADLGDGGGGNSSLRALFGGFTPAEGKLSKKPGSDPSGAAPGNWHMLSLGAAGAGLGWHMHGRTWIGLVHTRRRWRSNAACRRQDSI
jgi:hypothetical protein